MSKVFEYYFGNTFGSNIRVILFRVYLNYDTGTICDNLLEP